MVRGVEVVKELCRERERESVRETESDSGNYGSVKVSEG